MYVSALWRISWITDAGCLKKSIDVIPANTLRPNQTMPSGAAVENAGGHIAALSNMDGSPWFRHIRWDQASLIGMKPKFCKERPAKNTGWVPIRTEATKWRTSPTWGRRSLFKSPPGSFSKALLISSTLMVTAANPSERR